ncbi:hypothetical protein EV401DRAFT_727743 [Pisolithus croceorrhizus]|nr:hypothetical protein EV401DRAFT_727743 [Pisolithus croceorrhizus]
MLRRLFAAGIFSLRTMMLVTWNLFATKSLIQVLPPGNVNIPVSVPTKIPHPSSSPDWRTHRWEEGPLDSRIARSMMLSHTLGTASTSVQHREKPHPLWCGISSLTVLSVNAGRPRVTKG